MAVYFNGNKILDLKTLGLDPTKVYTKEEINNKLLEYQRKMKPLNDNDISSICGGTIMVSATTGDIGMVDASGLTTYTAAGSVDIGKGWSKVTINDNNLVDYDVLTGIAKFKIYSGLKNTKVYTTIKYF